MKKIELLRNRESHPWLVVVVIILIAAGLKLFFVFSGRFPFNADEAIVGLMAVHITQGQIPIFFYGQAYMGSLDAMIVSLFFLVFGKSILAIRIVQILLYSGTIATTYLVAYRMTRKPSVGWIAALLLAIPTVNATLYSTISLGGYGEALLLGNIIILVGSSLIEKWNRAGLFFLGCLVGFGLWVNGLTLVFSIPTMFMILYRLLTSPFVAGEKWKITGFIFVLFGIILGAFPWWIHGLQNGFDALIAELLGSAISTSNLAYLPSVGYRLVSFLLFGITVILGFRPSWEIRWLMLPLIPVVAGIWIVILFGIRKVFRSNPGMRTIAGILWGVILTTIAGFTLTSFGNDPSGRYFIPISIPLAIFAGVYLSEDYGSNKKWSWLVLVILVFFNLGSNIQCWDHYPPGFTTQFDKNTLYRHEFDQELIEFLSTNGIDRGYTTYWVAYPLAFQSDEKIIFIPRLPYHMDFSYTPRDDRYPEYDILVSEAHSIAYITAGQPWLDTYLRVEMKNQAIKFREQVIGDYRIFFDLSRMVTPSELGLNPFD